MTKRLTMAGSFLVLIATLGPTDVDAQVNVPAGGDLQAALNSATPGQTITLAAGATYTGNFVLPAKTAGAAITVKSSATLPDRRILDTDESLMPVLKSANALQALRSAPGAAHWRIDGLVFTAASNGDIVQFGDAISTDPATYPNDIAIDRSIIRTETPGGTSKNGIVINGTNLTIRRSRVLGVKSTAAESHAIIGWGGAGPFLVEDNYIEAGSCGFFIGGAAPAITGLIPSDIVFRWNTVTRPIALKSQTGWGIKNLFELKNAQRVQAYGNLFEHNWPDGQSGFSIVLTVRANSLNAPWTTIRDVVFRDNIVRNVAMAFNVLGVDNQIINGQVVPSQPMDNVVIRNNLIYGIDRQVWTSPTGTIGSGAIMNIDGAPRNLVVENNTAVGPVTGNIFVLTGQPIPGLVVQRNIFQKLLTPFQTFGVFGNAVGEGNAAFTAYAPDAVFTDNVLAGATAGTYSSKPGNLFPTVGVLHADFVNLAGGNLRLVPGSVFAGRGMDQDAIEAAMVPTADVPAAAPAAPSGHVIISEP